MSQAGLSHAPEVGDRLTFVSVDGGRKRVGWVADVRGNKARVMDVLMPVEAVGWTWSEWIDWREASCPSD